MNHCGIQQNSSFSSFGNGDLVVCPKPRRLSLFTTAVNEPVRPFRRQMCYQPETTHESKPCPELLDLIFPPEQNCPPAAASPPFFCGSPPSRVSNPLIQDARFTSNDKIPPISPHSIIPNPNNGNPPSSPSSSSSLTSSTPSPSRFLRPNYNNKPSVRIEGFDCHNRRNCSIPALA